VVQIGDGEGVSKALQEGLLQVEGRIGGGGEVGGQVSVVTLEGSGFRESLERGEEIESTTLVGDAQLGVAEASLLPLVSGPVQGLEQCRMGSRPLEGRHIFEADVCGAYRGDEVEEVEEGLASGVLDVSLLATDGEGLARRRHPPQICAEGFELMGLDSDDVPSPSGVGEVVAIGEVGKLIVVDSRHDLDGLAHGCGKAPDPGKKFEGSQPPLANMW